MNKKKLETITNLFEGNEIRSVWNSYEEDYYFCSGCFIGFHDDECTE